MMTTLLASTSRWVLGFHKRYELLSFSLKPYTIPFQDVCPSFGFLVYEDPGSDDLQVRQVGVLPVKELARFFPLECRIGKLIA